MNQGLRRSILWKKLRAQKSCGTIPFKFFNAAIKYRIQELGWQKSSLDCLVTTFWVPHRSLNSVIACFQYGTFSWTINSAASYHVAPRKFSNTVIGLHHYGTCLLCTRARKNFSGYFLGSYLPLGSYYILGCSDFESWTILTLKWRI